VELWVSTKDVGSPGTALSGYQPPQNAPCIAGEAQPGLRGRLLSVRSKDLGPD